MYRDVTFQRPPQEHRNVSDYDGLNDHCLLINLKMLCHHGATWLGLKLLMQDNILNYPMVLKLYLKVGIPKVTFRIIATPLGISIHFFRRYSVATDTQLVFIILQMGDLTTTHNNVLLSCELSCEICSINI